MATTRKQTILMQVGRATFIALAWALALGAIAPVLAQAQTFKTLYKFTEQDPGSSPGGPLVRDAAGNLYATAGSNASGDGNGAVFEFNPSSGGMTFLYVFPGTGGNGEDGAQPQGVVFGTDGNLYGDTFDGGYNNNGLMYELTLSGQFTIVHNFQSSPSDGSAPLSAPLLPEPSGLFYGVTFEGGNGICRGVGKEGLCGVVFQVDTSGNESVIYNFQNSPDGYAPIGGLSQDAQGNLYGVTFGGGAYPGALCGGLGDNYGENCGAVFKLSQGSGGDWTESIIHSFTGGVDGATPSPALAIDSHGNLYGTANFFGNPDCIGGCGTLYKIDTNGNFSLLHSFNGAHDGGYHPCCVVVDSSGNLYGVTGGGEPSCDAGCGTVFKYDTMGKYTVLHKFDAKDGFGPHGLNLDENTGILYGITGGGGACNFCGTIFEITP